jgi:hypothetical protein
MPSGVYPRKPLAERFWLKVDKDGPAPEHRPELGPCWLWTAGKDHHGYGVFWAHGRSTSAHRAAYELLIGPVPDGLDLDHVCHNDSGCAGAATCLHRRCVNPDHLEAVTTRENILRGVSPSALSARKTHCLRGHEFTPENTYVKPSGIRECRTCRDGQLYRL